MKTYQPGHPPSLIRVFSVHSNWAAKDPSFFQADSEDWSDWVDAQADVSLPWVHMPLIFDILISTVTLNIGPRSSQANHFLPLSKWFELQHDKTNIVTVHPAKTQISLGIRAVWSVFTVRLMGS